jgi:hypothetical protein
MTDKRLSHHKPAIYCIHVQGILDESWSDRLGGMTITTVNKPEKSPVTRLAGYILDQAALLGVLNTLYDLRLPLLSVECEDWQDQD